MELSSGNLSTFNPLPGHKGNQRLQKTKQKI